MCQKECTKCRVIKPLAEYSANKNGKFGKSSWCKQCVRENSKKWYADNKEKISATHRSYYYSNKDLFKKLNADWYRDNIDRVASMHRKWYAEHRDEIAEWRKEYYERNKDLIAARHKAYREDHKDEIAARAKAKREQDIDAYREGRREYYAKNKERINAKAKIYREKYKEKRREYGKRYREENKDKINQKKVERLHSDPVFRLKEQSRNMLRCSFMTRKHHKNNHFFDIVGCSADELTVKLKKTWFDRYGYEWNGEPCHIDHIIPLATADTYEEVAKLCHYTNLQLLTPEDNLSKSDKLQNRPT